MDKPPQFQGISRRALEFISDGDVIGLGTGHAATVFINALGERVKEGLRVRGIPTSAASADLARRLNIPLTDFDAVDRIDVDVDGADEVDPQRNLIKGYGGALVREKIVAAASRRLFILVGPEKLVPTLGKHGKLPVEVVPFGVIPCSRALNAIGCTPIMRMASGKPLVTDNGNHILDCQIAPLTDPQQLERSILTIPGVVGTGLFLDMNPTVLVQNGDQVQELSGKA
jgi:ribose 5-phosphate isomerase A